MNARRLSGAALGFTMVCMAPFVAAMQTSQVEEPWPALLASEPVDHNIALLQLRANLALDRLIHAEQPADQGS